MLLFKELKKNLSYTVSRDVSIFLQNYVILERPLAWDIFIILLVFIWKFYDYFGVFIECKETFKNKQQTKIVLPYKLIF